MRSSKTYFKIRYISIWGLTICLVGGLMLIGAAKRTGTTPQGRQKKEIQKDWFKGHWLYEDAQSSLEVSIDPNWTFDDKLMVYISDYCQPLIADFLLFNWQDGCLEFVDAVEKNYSYDLPRIFQIELRLQVSGFDTLLIYEAVEAECQNYQYFQLEKISAEPPALIKNKQQQIKCYDL